MVVYKIHYEVLHNQLQEKVGLLATNSKCLKRGKINRKKKRKEGGSRRLWASESLPSHCLLGYVASPSKCWEVITQKWDKIRIYTGAAVHDVGSDFDVVVATRLRVVWIKISYCIHLWVRDPKWRSSTKGHRGADAFELPSPFRVWRLNSFLLVEPEIQELSPFISAMIERSDPLVMAQFSKLIPQCVKRRRRVPVLKNKSIFCCFVDFGV